MISPKKSIKDAQGYESPLYAPKYLMKLDFNENIIGPSPKVIEALRNITDKDVKFYPIYGDLITKIAEYNNVGKDMILPTNGADEAINYIFDTFIEPEDTVLTVIPAFSMPKVYAISTGCNYKEIKYQEKWKFPIDEFIKNIDEKTKLAIITSPNSPTGEAISRNDLIKVLERAKDSLVLIDETYAGYANERFIDLVDKYPNVIITKSMSKDFAIAGLRLGYIISNKQNIEYIRRIISPFSVNILAAKAGVAALDDVEYFESVKQQIIESRVILTEGLKGIAKKVYPSESNFLLIDFGYKAEFIYKRLLNSGIKVKFFKNDPDLENCFRITVPSPQQARILLDSLKPKETIIFDMDGVLVDTRESYRLAIKETYNHFSGRDISYEDIQKAKNLGGLNNDWDLTEHLLKQAGVEIPKQEIIDKFQELYFGNDGTGYIINEDFLAKPELLKELAKKYDLAIFTGRPKKEAEFALKIRGLNDLFYPVITMEDVPEGKHKPDPWGINFIIDLISSNTAYYLGDTPDDMIAAREAGVKGIGILPPQDKSEELRKKMLAEGASTVLNSIKEFNSSILSQIELLL